MGVRNPRPDATAGDDTCAGDATAEIADGLAGDDVLRGGAENDARSGNVADATLDGGASDDPIDAGVRRDRASFESAPNEVVIDLRPQGGGQVIVRADIRLGIEGLVGWAFDDIQVVSRCFH